MAFEHYVLTRFNHGLYDRTDIDHADWMNARLRLFDTYTLPSMMRQTNMNFKWVLSFDHRTPADILIRYDYVDNIIITHDHLVAWMKANVDNDKWLITTRMDNDDYVEKNWIEMIQGAFDGRTKVVDTFGRVLDLNAGIYYSSGKAWPNSMFISLIEHGSACKTCYQTQHTNMIARYESVWLPRYGWTIVVHERNLRNAIRETMQQLPPVFQYIYVNG